MKFNILGVATAALFTAAVPAFAHHSFAMFANDKTSTLTGTAKEVEWVNPHAWLHIVVMNDAGKSEEWAFEMGSPGQLATQGWKKDSVKPGDKIAVTFHPMADGSHGGSEMSVKTANGVVLGGAGAGRGAAPAAGAN